MASTGNPGYDIILTSFSTTPSLADLAHLTEQAHHNSAPILIKVGLNYSIYQAVKNGEDFSFTWELREFPFHYAIDKPTIERLGFPKPGDPAKTIINENIPEEIFRIIGYNKHFFPLSWNLMSSFHQFPCETLALNEHQIFMMQHMPIVSRSLVRHGVFATDELAGEGSTSGPVENTVEITNPPEPPSPTSSSGR